MKKPASYVPVSIPTTQSFLSQWHAWVQLQVNKHFKRDKDRAYDVAQDVRVRLLSKEFINRWFFKHLTDDLVDRPQAERILGGAQITFIGAVAPVHGKRSSPDSLWRVSDLLRFARYDHERYYYSIQNHTIDSDKVLRLMGYKPGEYGALESLYRQGRLKPSELTEHRCSERFEYAAPADGLCSVEGCGRPHYSRGYCSSCYRKARVQRCPDCDRGREALKARGLSLTHRWTDPAVSAAVAQLRWNDSQLKPFLRAWRRTNMVRCAPLYIMRTSPKPGIDAGLLKYAKIIIDNEVFNSFKRMARADDLSVGVFNKGVSGEFANDETCAWEGDSDSDEGLTRVLRDVSSSRAFGIAEDRLDFTSLVEASGLGDDELAALVDSELREMTSRELAGEQDSTVPRVQRARASAARRLRDAEVDHGTVDRVLRDAATAHGCSVHEVTGRTMFGKPVLARSAACARLHDLGMGVSSIAAALSIPEDRVVAAINRSVIHESRVLAAE